MCLMLCRCVSLKFGKWKRPCFFTVLQPLAAQSCPALCDPIWTVAHQHPLSIGIFQARILECAAMHFSRGSSQPRNQTQVSCIAGGFFTVWATRKPRNTGVDCHALIQGFLPDPGIKPGSPALQADSLPTVLSGKPWITFSSKRKWNLFFVKHHLN